MNSEKVDNQAGSSQSPFRVLGRWIKVIILLYSLIGIALFYLQEYFLFHPKVLPGDHQYHFDVPFVEMDLPFSNTDTINMVKFFPKDSTRKGVVIYFMAIKKI